QAEGTVKIYALKAPAQVHRPPLSEARPYYPGSIDSNESEESDQTGQSDLSNPNNWPLAEVITNSPFSTGTNGLAKLSFTLPAGSYRALLETQDRFGKKVTGRLPVQVLNPSDTKLAIKIPHLLESPAWETQPEQEFMALWGTGYDEGRAFIEI